MKRIVILIYVVVAMLASAQGDTLDNNLQSNYMRSCVRWTYDDWYSHLDTFWGGDDWWESFCLPTIYGISTPGPAFSLVYDHGEEYSTERPVRVIGAAAVATMQHWADTGTSWFWNGYYPNYASNPGAYFPNTLDTTVSGRLDEYLSIYQKVGNADPVLLTQGAWRIENHHRYLHLPGQHDQDPLANSTGGGSGHRYGNPTAPFHNDTIAIEPLYEVYFDKPVVVEDTFIVMGTCNNNAISRVKRLYNRDWGRNSRGEWMYLWNHNPTRYWSVLGVTDTSEHPTNCNYTWVHLHDSVINQYRWDRHNGILRRQEGRVFVNTNLIYPILDPTYDTCDQIASLCVAAVTDSTITCMWSGGNNIEWEVKYVREGATDTAYQTTTVPTATLTGLRPSTYYEVSVRGKCDSAGDFGGWSEPEYMRTDRQGEPQHIAQLDRFTQLMPNPASDVVNVVSYYRQHRVVVYDLKGNSVLEHKDPGTSTTFSVSILPKGIYVVAIHTPAGIATKRLVVE